jgi:hypothetical protein
MTVSCKINIDIAQRDGFHQTLHTDYKKNLLMLCGEIIADRSEIHAKYINSLCGQNVQFWNVKYGGTQSDHSSLRG